MVGKNRLAVEVGVDVVVGEFIGGDVCIGDVVWVGECVG